MQLQTDPLCRAKRPPEKTEGRILIVDDDYSARRALHGTLLSAGFDVADIASGAEALALTQVVRYDAVLLSLPTPVKSGIGICRELRRKFPRLAILILAAGETEDEEVETLDSGADDYIAKPFQMRELIAHVRAAVRRVRAPLEPSAGLIRIGEIELQSTNRLVRKSRTLVPLTPKQFDLLHYLMAHAGEPIPHAQLLSAVWGEDFVGQVEYLRVFVRELRKKLEDDARSPKFILTHRSVGYWVRVPTV